MKRKFDPPHHHIADSEVIDLCESEEQDENRHKSKKHASHSEVIGHSEDSCWKPFYLTTIRGIPSNHNRECISFADLFSFDEHNPITQVILMNYMIEISWMLSVVPHLADVPLLCLTGSSIDSHNLPRHSSWTIAKVDMGMERYGTHHSKIAIVFYKQGGLRLAITTANFIEEDFSYLTQGLYTQDFPLKSEDLLEEGKYDLGRDLVDYFHHVHTNTSKSKKELDNFCERIKEYDFSSASIILLPSIPGRFKGNDIQKWGIGRLQHILENEECLFTSKQKFVETGYRLVMQYSSLGSMGNKGGRYIDELASCMIYRQPWKEIGYTANNKGGYSSNNRLDRISELDIVWPTVDCVRNSLAGYSSGNSLPCSFKNMFEVPTSTGGKPRLLEGFQGRLRHWNGTPSGRQRAPAHMKCYFPYKVIDGKDVELAWFVLTSSNLSQAAWGVYQTNGSQLYIKSYELGVLFLPTHITNNNCSRKFSCTPNHPLLGLDTISDWKEEKTVVFKAGLHQNYEEGANRQIIIRFPVPFEVPPASYESEKDYPWLWDYPYQIPDCLGRMRNIQ